jgi:hypothetical protein
MIRRGRNAAEGAEVGRDPVEAEVGRDPVAAAADAQRWEVG